MKKILIGLLCSTLFMSAQSETGNDEAEKREVIIYKWVEDGTTNYSHLLPDNISNYIKLDSEGFILEDIEESSEVNGLLRPVEELESAKVTDEKDASADKDAAPKTDVEKATDLIKKKNCDIVTKNGKQLSSNEAFDMTPSGVVILKGKELKEKRAQNQKDIDYYCN